MDREIRSCLLMVDSKDDKNCRIQGKQWIAMCSIVEKFLE